jgi:hypothetical protein
LALWLWDGVLKWKSAGRRGAAKRPLMRVYVHLYVAITHKYLLLHYRRTLGIVVMGWSFEMEIRREAGERLLTFVTLSLSLEMLVLLYCIDVKK